MAAEQPAVQPDVGDQEGAVEAQQGPLAMPWPRKSHPVPDCLVAAGGTVQARHHGRRPGIVVAVESRKTAILSLAERRDRHPPAGVELLSIQGLRWKQRETVVH